MKMNRSFLALSGAAIVAVALYGVPADAHTEVEAACNAALRSGNESDMGAFRTANPDAECKTETKTDETSGTAESTGSTSGETTGGATGETTGG